ncbi:MAG: hypothetical protein ACK4VI_06575 [Alphaproteobacteria bacterium]
MAFRVKFLAVLSLPLLLSACGEGYEIQLTNTHFPYGNERTAGSGVVYVLAKMMPEKTLNLAPAERALTAPPAQTPAPTPPPAATPMDEVFTNKQNK